MMKSVIVYTFISSLYLLTVVILVLWMLLLSEIERH